MDSLYLFEGNSRVAKIAFIFVSLFTASLNAQEVYTWSVSYSFNQEAGATNGAASSYAEAEQQLKAACSFCDVLGPDGTSFTPSGELVTQYRPDPQDHEAEMTPWSDP